MKVTAYKLVSAINSLPRENNYTYVNPSNNGLIHIENIVMPDGPIHFKRWNSNDEYGYEAAQVESISSEMLWRIANAIYENEPINFDRILGASYNTRSVLEALLAATPEFYYCYPGRIMNINGRSSIRHGHKHLIWLPNEPHQLGSLEEKELADMAVSEIPIQSVTYDSLILSDTQTQGAGLDIDEVRRHTQIQIALYKIGLQLDYRTWIAKNDRGAIYNGKPLSDYPNIIQTLNSERLISNFDNAVQSAKYIDCIWFNNHRFMPAVMEVEHTTGITPGLTRMQCFRDTIPSILTRYVIVAPDDLREKVIEEATKPLFRPLKVRYFPYSSVEELYHICTHRKLRGVTDEFLDCFMEKISVN